jgi:DnaJ family protein C protein 2
VDAAYKIDPRVVRRKEEERQERERKKQEKVGGAEAAGAEAAALLWVHLDMCAYMV